MQPGECVVLDGPSGMGKSTLLKMIYANYRVNAGRITVRSADGAVVDVTQATPRALVQLRRDTVGYVSQFLRVIPRVSALDVVAEPLAEDAGDDPAGIEAAREAARQWLTRLRIPERLWHLPPATFSGGEQQRINIARNMIKPKPLLLLDEPTASLDAANTETVITMIREAVARGAALVGSVDQVLSEIHDYMKMGIRAFIFSGYPHLQECEMFGTKVLPHLRTVSLAQEYGRVPEQTPATPLGNGVRR